MLDTNYGPGNPVAPTTMHKLNGVTMTLSVLQPKLYKDKTQEGTLAVLRRMQEEATKLQQVLEEAIWEAGG